MLRKEFDYLHSTRMSFIYFPHICLKLWGHNDNVLKHKSIIQQNKYNNLLKKPHYNSEKIIFNYSSYVSSEVEKTFLLKVLNFSILPKHGNHVDYLVNFKLFYRDICDLEIVSEEDLDFVKAKLSI